MARKSDSEKNAEIEAVEADRLLAAEKIIRNKVWWSAGAGAIPVAYLDIAVISAVQIKMMKELAALYDVPFKAHLGKAAVASLIGSVVPVTVGYGLFTTAMFQSFLRATPVVGPLIGLAAVGGFAAAATHAIGTVFNQHFASGGTFLTFDAQKVDAFFREQFAAARRKGASLIGGAAA